MASKKESKNERSRKVDKVVPETHREFLDMDTDEEDFGRQETPEVEEELPPEPEKPVFTEEELIILIQYVKNLTVLPSLKDTDWNDECQEVIREYFRNPANLILAIFYQENVLRACLKIPNYVQNGLTYFLRSPWQIYTVNNFLNTVLFGSINDNVKNSVLNFMENIYATVALKSNDWPQIIRNELFLNLHEFLVRLIDDVYKSKGLRVLYVPRESVLQTISESDDKYDCFLSSANDELVFVEKNEETKELIKRLENIVWHWIKQIREELKPASARKNIRSILEEVDYWKSKHSNLISLRSQLSNSDICVIMKLLKSFHSPNAETIQQLTLEIELKKKETSSNLKYLNVLLESGKNLNILDNVEASLTHTLLLIFFIWSDSPFYNSTGDMEIICRALSLQIIQQWKDYIQLDVAFGSNPEDGIKIIENCILYCDTYRAVYDNIMAEMIKRINPGKHWNVNVEEVFNSIDTFKQRCYDVIDICQALIIFGRCSKVGLFGSPKGTEYETYCRKIEAIFYESLEEVMAVRDVIFDVSKATWMESIRKFRATIVQLENMVKNLINIIFENVKNIEEGIEAIHALQKFKQTKVFQETLSDKWSQVAIIFKNEVDFCYTTLMEKKAKYDWSSHDDDVEANINCTLQYLQNQYDTMINASDWISDSDIPESVLQQYKRVFDAIGQRKKAC